MELVNLSLTLIGVGIFFMLLAILKTRSILGLLNDKKEIDSWRILFFLMMFFLIGYAASFYFILNAQQQFLIVFTGMVFLFGALFVFIVSRISFFTIKDLILKDKSADLVKILNANEIIIKQKSESLEHVNRELEDERKKLEDKVKERTSELTNVNIKLKNEIEEHKKAEQELAENKNRLQKQNKALFTITKCLKVDNDSLTKSIPEITKIASETIGAERVSLWLYDETKISIRCIDLYESTKNTHTDGVVLSAKNYPAYFKALELNRVIDASDANKDPRTFEYSETYLKPLGITSMLDAPIRKAGKMIGIICFEHVGPQRIWTIDEQLFAAAIGDSFSVLLESIERIKAEKTLAEKEKQLSSIYDTVGDAIFNLSIEKDGRYKFVSVNKAFVTTTGVTSNQVVGKYVDEIIPQPSLSIVLEKYKKAILEKKIIRWEEVSNYPTGQLIGEVSIAPIFDENGNCTFLVGSVHDITDRKKDENTIRKLNEELDERVKERTSELVKTQESLQLSEEKYRKIVEEAGDCVYSSDYKGDFTYINPICKKITGYTENDFLEKNFTEVIDPEWKEKVAIFYKEQFDNKIKETLFTFPIITKSKEKKWVEQIVTQQQEGDKITGHHAIVRDITERKNAEEKLKEYQYFFNNSHDLIGIANEQNFLEIFNPTLQKVLGYSEKELLEKQFLDFIHPDDLNSTLQELEKLKAGAITINFTNRYRKKEGDYLWLDWNANFDRITGKFYAVARDITERKKAEDELISTNERFLKIFDNNAIGMALVNVETNKFQNVNDFFVSKFGYTKEEVIGKTGTEINVIEPESYEKVLTLLKQQGYVRDFEALVRKKNGETFWSISSIQPMKINNENFFLSSFYDITELKKTEEELKQKSEELERSNKELEQFAYVASHDLQAPLRMVTSYLQLLEKRYKDKLDKDAKDFINFAVDGSNRMRALIASLLDYSRINRVKPFEDINLNELLKEILGDLKTDIATNKAVITIEPLPNIFGDKVLIGQLFQNLISNAVKFKGERNPEILISGKKNNDEYLFYVKDNGIGIQKEYASKLFVIFQRLNTQDQYPGTGIGLAICKKIVERHGGKIWFESEFGKGTTFYFTIKEKIENPNDEKPKEENLKVIDNNVVNITT